MSHQRRGLHRSRTDGHETEREKRSEWASQTEWRARMPRCLAENMGRRLCSKCHGVEQILKGPEGGRLFPVWHRMSMILPYFCMLPNPLRIALPPKAVSSFSSLSSSLASLADCRHKTTTVPTWALERGGAAGGRAADSAQSASQSFGKCGRTPSPSRADCDGRRGRKVVGL